MITRKDYLNGPATHEDYYNDLIDAAGGPTAFLHMIPRDLAVIRKALDNGDEHLNTIPLGHWSMPFMPTELAKAMRDRGDYPTRAGATCVLKQAAKRLASDTVPEQDEAFFARARKERKGASA
jgi:hypothetical protein